ncbi:Rho termination factor N-terminal domain-containing protein [Zunongwangia sp. SCSIO 43204]|uniref:Rho termination factor N-terminal domain-containing protein n=1 Tax=Zunongwangia sp. SCSIO 43204 TaxID=2779359 RepID=UPI001CAA3277|nr:Rho termination factor N-terminal domain-containing protein [Zunongwangia sp. SCSIO 43204]UAB85684.1 Rho termination factor N-terminal domain-containing protein [Zunongwangia sp. SCSIO 43204]
MDWLSLDKETIFRGKDDHGNRYLSQFLRDYKQTFNPKEINAGCDRCLEDYYRKLTKHLQIMGAKKPNSGYKLKEKYDGIPLSFGSREFAFNATLTDKQAEQLIKNHKKGKDLFDTIPDKTKKEGSENKETVINLSKSTRPELDEMAKGLGIEKPEELANKDAVIEAIEKAQAEQDKTKKEGSENKD